MQRAWLDKASAHSGFACGSSVAARLNCVYTGAGSKKRNSRSDEAGRSHLDSIIELRGRMAGPLLIHRRFLIESTVELCGTGGGAGRAAAKVILTHGRILGRCKSS